MGGIFLITHAAHLSGQIVEFVDTEEAIDYVRNKWPFALHKFRAKRLDICSGPVVLASITSLDVFALDQLEGFDDDDRAYDAARENDLDEDPAREAYEERMRR